MERWGGGGLNVNGIGEGVADGLARPAESALANFVE
jgi:hypothetical protein